jgi:hypothetical protein
MLKQKMEFISELKKADSNLNPKSTVKNGKKNGKNNGRTGALNNNLNQNN